jgi:small subunit ribosomal protein S5
METNVQKKQSPASPSRTPYRGGGASRGGRPGGSRDGSRGSNRTFERPRPEFEQKIVAIRRVTRVVSGGRRMSFAVALAIGDKKGSIGLGTGKGNDTALAINKALRVAKKNLFRVDTTKELSLKYGVDAKYCSSVVEIMPNRGKGIVAGSVARDIINLGGFKNITIKFHSGTKNKLNNSRAVIKAFEKFKLASTKKLELVEQVQEQKA